MASSQAPAAAADSLDPIYEWLDDGDKYLLHLNLPEGFKKEDFRVQVDGEGRLTVIGQRRPAHGAAAADGKATRLHKVFQLPSTANLDAVSGRFDGTVLTLKVPKLPQTAAAAAGDAAEPQPLPPTPPTTQAKEEPAQLTDGGKPKPADQEDKAAHQKPKPVAPAPPPPPQATEKARGDDQDDKARAEHREKVAREAARRVEAARARVAEAKAKAKAERERQCEQWKERAMEEGLKLADAVNRNKEVIATAVAAFTLGVFFSSKLFSRS